MDEVEVRLPTFEPDQRLRLASLAEAAREVPAGGE